MMSDRIEEITQKLVVNAVTGTPGSASFKERELRQRLVPELLAAERDRIRCRLDAAASDLTDAGDTRGALWIDSLIRALLA